MELEKLASELERQKTNSKDVIVDSRKIEASVFDVTPEEGIGLFLGEGKAIPLTEWAHQQLAEKTGIPTKYYNRMLTTERFELVAQNVNAWIKEKERRLIRIVDNKVRAILSDRYRPMDNYDLLFCALAEFKQHGVEIHRCDLTETNMFIKAVQLHEMREIQENDKVVPGVILSNSEVGAGSFKVEPFMLRLVCNNGMIGEQVIRKIHLGERRDVGDIWSDETLRKKDETLWSETTDVIKATFDPTIFNEWVDKMKRGTEVEVESPTKAVNNIAAKYNINEDKKNELLDYFTTKEAPTQWGLANAVTRIAQNEVKTENQVELEKVGNDIAILEPDEFLKEIRKEKKA
ncbi:MAG: DUF932 domain-containing protein [Methanomicrobia archaeon]|nr:DUF932 domain-containing protein [Methanomicrobia archaeon]